jgi:hypothetical protein
MDALYFPYLSLPASTWVNPTLLYFDRLAVIAPEGAPRNIFDDRTHELIRIGLVCPLVPRAGWGGDEDEKLVAYILGRASVTKRYDRIERIHAGKLAYSFIADALSAAGLLVRDGSWFEGPDWVIAHIMTYLAVQLSSHAPGALPLITDERAAAGVVSGSPESLMISRRLKGIARLLPVPPDVPPDELQRFKEDNRRELHAFRSYVDGLITSDASGDLDDGFEERLREAKYTRDHLLDQVRACDWRWQGPEFLVSVAVSGAALLDHAPWTFGASVLNLALDGARGFAAWRRGHEAARHPLVYATRVVGKWQGGRR